MVDMTLIRPLNKGQGHLFWYQSIYYRLLIVTFCCRTHRLATIHHITDDDTTLYQGNSATVSTVG